MKRVIIIVVEDCVDDGKFIHTDLDRKDVCINYKECKCGNYGEHCQYCCMPKEMHDDVLVFLKRHDIAQEE